MRRLLAALSLLAFATQAQAGFLEELFGIRPQPAPYDGPAPSPYYGPPPYEHDAPLNIRPDKGPRMPKPIDVPALRMQSTCCKHGEDPMRALLNDSTLMRGDVVMTTEGLRTFVGSRPPHSMRDFVPVDKATTLSSERKRQLLALDR